MEPTTLPTLALMYLGSIAATKAALPLASDMAVLGVDRVHAIGDARPASHLKPPQAVARAEGDLGRPTIVLDRLEFPSDLPGAAYYKRHLVFVLKREARRADWGAGRDNRIEYRFFVRELELRYGEGVLHVDCTAIGKLPGGKSAKSRLTFGGPPTQKRELVKRVLEIVARGVITRLAELERRRRGLE